MEPRRGGRRVRADTVSNWWGSLDARDNTTLRADRLIPATLILAATAVGAAMPLPWHHLVVPAQVYSGPLTAEVINGLNTASWLLGVAAVELTLAIRTYVAASSSSVKWSLTVLAFANRDGNVRRLL
jgi:hypothetical protein